MLPRHTILKSTWPLRNGEKSTIKQFQRKERHRLADNTRSAVVSGVAISTKATAHPMVSNRALLFAEIPDGLPEPGKHLQVHRQDDFDIETAPPAGGFTARVLYASFDPYLRHLMVSPEKARPGFEPLPLGSVFHNGLVARVLKSDCARVRPGDNVVGMAPIQEYISVSSEDATQFSLIENPQSLDLSLYLGPLGMAGLTGFSGLYEIGKPKRGETIFVSAASGAVGQVVAQLARREGLKVICSVGSDEKLKILTEVFGFDHVFNYREGDILGQLKKRAPEGINSELSRA